MKSVPLYYFLQRSLSLFVDIYIAIKSIFRNSEVFGDLIPGFGDKESSAVVEIIDRLDLIFLGHEGHRNAYKFNGLLDELV